MCVFLTFTEILGKFFDEICNTLRDYQTRANMKLHCYIVESRVFFVMLKIISNRHFSCGNGFYYALPTNSTIEFLL